MEKQKNKIFIVEDESFNINVLIDLLRPKYDIAMAKNGATALTRIKEVKPDLILLDVMLPEMDGYEICEKLKADELTKHIPVIFMTVKNATEDIVRAFRIGAADYVVKPINYMELLSRVKTHLQLINYIRELKKSNEEIKRLSGLLPICPRCKKVRNDKGYWEKVDLYLTVNNHLEFSHGLCPDCLKKLYPTLSVNNKYAMKKKEEETNEKENILIVEDELFNISILVDILKPHYKITVAKNGQKALELIDKIYPDLILLDIMMPGIDGFEVCEELKKHSNSKDVPIVFMTVKRETNDMIKAFQIGAVDYIIKPINYEELLARVRTHLLIRKTISDLKKAQTEIKTLNNLLPICVNCKKIRDDEGYWNEVEQYIGSRSKLEFEQSLCPQCRKELEEEDKL